jgi:Skp family chaperone for outer membrane proteins
MAFAQVAAMTTDPKTTATAVVDVDHILDNHPTFIKDMESMKAEYQKTMEDFEARRKKLASEAEQLNGALSPDSAEFKQKQESLVQADSKMRLEVVNKEKEFGERQARLILDTYNQIVGGVNGAAQYFKYDMVVRYSRKQISNMNAKKPPTVQMGLDREVIYFNPQHDLTDTVIAMLKRDIPAAAPSPKTGAVPQTQLANPRNGPVRR